jgi:hypothetical protein
MLEQYSLFCQTADDTYTSCLYDPDYKTTVKVECN